jgi:hypothetical protein
MAGTKVVSGIARWGGGSWTAVRNNSSSPEGVNANVYAMTVADNAIYIGGSFTEAGGLSARRVASWNGSSWSALGDGVNGTVYALARMDVPIQGDIVAVGGSFTNAGGVQAKRYAWYYTSPPPPPYAEWRGDSLLGEGFNGSVLALSQSYGGFVGGSFTVAESASARRIAQFTN